MSCRSGILEADAPQVRGVIPASLVAIERDGLIADDAGTTVGDCRIDTPCIQVRLGAGDEEGTGLLQGVQPLEVQIAAIHDVDRSGFRHQHIEHIDIVQLAVGDVDEAGNIATQVEQRMHLDRRLGRAKRCPRKHRQAQIDSGGVQGISRVLQLPAEAVVGIEFPGLRDQSLGELGMDAPVPRLVGIGQRGSLDRLSKSHVVELGRLCRETNFDVAQALPIGQLGEGHHAELLGARHRLHVAVAIAAIDDAMERLPGKEVHQLREQRLACVHEPLRVSYPRNWPGTPFCRSNRRHPSSAAIPRQSWLSATTLLVSPDSSDLGYITLYDDSPFKRH